MKVIWHPYNEETGEFRDFDHHYNEQLYLFHKKEIRELATFFFCDKYFTMHIISWACCFKGFWLATYHWQHIYSNCQSFYFSYGWIECTIALNYGPCINCIKIKIKCIKTTNVVPSAIVDAPPNSSRNPNVGPRMTH